MFETLNAIDGGRPLCVAVIITALPVIMLVLYPIGKVLCLDQINDDEWDEAQIPPRSSLSRVEVHALLLKRATRCGQVWTASGVIGPLLIWANSGPAFWQEIGNVVFKCGLANVLAGIAFLAIVATDQRLNRKFNGRSYLLQLHFPSLLYVAAVALTWTGLLIAAAFA